MLRLSVILVVTIVAATMLSYSSSPAYGAGATTTWMPPVGGDGKWETAANWTKGVPDNTKDVVIPPDRGTITTDGTTKQVKSLNIQASVAGGTTLKPRDASKSLTVEAKGDIIIGKNNTVSGANGNNIFTEGGKVQLKSTGGNITNDGTLNGGNGNQGIFGFGGSVILEVPGTKTVTNTVNGKINGGNGGNGTNPNVPGGDGGDVKIKGGTVTNKGTETGGDGGGHVRGGKSGNGGKVFDNGREGTEKGKKAGNPGMNVPPAPPGKKGDVLAVRDEFLSLEPDAELDGDQVILATLPGGLISMAGVGPDAVVASTRICVIASGATVDLTGISASTVVMRTDPGGSIEIEGTILTDPGVTVADLAEPDPSFVLSPACQTKLNIASAVGGLAVDLNGGQERVPLNTKGPPGSNTGVLAAIMAVAVAAGALALGGGGWYVGRRRMRRG